MFFNKSTFALAFVALGSIVSAHQTPACVLSVIGNTSNPADLATICGSDAKKTETAISNTCGSSADSSLKFFANVCSGAGHQVAIPSTTATTATNTTSTGSGFATAVSTSGSKATGSSSGNGSGSGSSTGSSTSSGASGSSSASTALHTGAARSDRQLSGTTLLGAAVFAGVAAWL
ncbi:uncharacterized protein N7443_004420 [Penicillium atrosanguineum]|uniref:uncharacterized protein n=1 Tax=Penicillium atrosanguineum TaxID=1132637 RepID=UPI00238A35C9|nr:uncharacterized protein N7443_004420 [Penicillium atrosanguineum]KAJ5304760.1 hypothetical protein N7443_004420 [Penicillium atrosanguineum]